MFFVFCGASWLSNLISTSVPTIHKQLKSTQRNSTTAAVVSPVQLPTNELIQGSILPALAARDCTSNPIYPPFQIKVQQHAPNLRHYSTDLEY